MTYTWLISYLFHFFLISLFWLGLVLVVRELPGWIVEINFVYD